MKKTLISVALLLFFVSVFNSCYKQEDDIYNPKYKISHIWYDLRAGAPDETYTYQDKLLTKITYTDGGSYLLITHNKNKTINEIVMYSQNGTPSGEKVVMKYNKNKISSMEYSDNSVVMRKCEFTHSGKKISRIKEYINIEGIKMDKISKSKLFNLCFGDAPLLKKLLHLVKEKELALSNESVVTYTDNNITKITSKGNYSGLDCELTRTFTYDEMKNPYYGLTFYLADLSGYTENNVTKATYTYTILNELVSGTFTENYDYFYEYNENDLPTAIAKNNNQGEISYFYYEYYEE